MDFKLSTLRSHAKQFSYKNEATRIRFLTLIELAKRVPEGRICRFRECDFESVGARFGVSGRSVRRWWNAYRKSGAKALIAKKASGRKKNAIRGHTAALILRYRSLYRWGAVVIQKHLELDHGIFIGLYRIQEYLRTKELLRPVRQKKKSKHTRKVYVRIPGAHTQMDVKYFPKRLPNGHRMYVYNFRDHASKWTHKKAFASFGAAETKEFFLEVLDRFPGTIYSVQTDNGGEFTNRFISHVDAPKAHILDQICRQHGVRHRLIPPGEKELQGLVERSHREDEDELYSRINPKTLLELNTLLNAHAERLNLSRRRKNLDWKTSSAFLESYNPEEDVNRSELDILLRKMAPWRKEPPANP